MVCDVVCVSQRLRLAIAASALIPHGGSTEHGSRETRADITPVSHSSKAICAPKLIGLKFESDLILVHKRPKGVLGQNRTRHRVEFKIPDFVLIQLTIGYLFSIHNNLEFSLQIP